MTTIVAVDPGSVRIGLAFSEGAMALPWTVVERKDESYVDELVQVIRQRDAERVVVGLPMKLDGTEGAEAEEARELARVLQERLRLPVSLLDERLTTAAATRSLSHLSGRQRRRRIDGSAAAVLLQSYLDSKR